MGSNYIEFISEVSENMKIIKNMVAESKYKIKCPNNMTPTRIVVHETANDASAKSEIAYMISNDKETSFHFAVDDTEIVQGIPENRNAWHAGDGNGKGNREGIAVEICYSKSGGERWQKAIDNAAQFIAELLKTRNWGIDKVTKHQDYSGKRCPHRILDSYGWDNFLNLIQKYSAGEAPQNTEQNIAKEKISVTYQVWDDVKNVWLPNVTDLTDYAGIYGHDVCALFANLSKGNIIYKVHIKGGSWLPRVINRSDYAGVFNRPIDAVAMRTDTGKTIHYAVHLRRGNRWLPFVTGFDVADGDNGYAGILGQEIDAIKIYLD